MKKIISLVTALVLCLSLLAGCGQSSAPSSSAPAKSSAPAQPASSAPAQPASSAPAADDIFKNVKPLAEPVELTIGVLNGSHHGFPTYLVDKMGGFKKANIKVNWKVFANGPVMVEAVAANGWDIGTYGIGGTLAGAIGQGIIHPAASARDFDSLQFFAKADDPIVKAGKNNKDYPELYGTAETWKGREIYLPTGTTLHYTLGVALEKFGLKDTDVKLTHMDVTNTNTAMRAGKGQIWGLWGNFSYATDLKDKGLVPVIKSSDVKGELVTTFAVNPRTYKDPKKYEAVKKWMEMYFIATDWLHSGNNIDKAAPMYVEWNETTGVKSTVAEVVAQLKNNKHYTLKESYDMWMAKSKDGKMSVQEELNYKPLMFFISKGNYKPEDAQKFLNGTMDPKIIKELYEKK